MSQSDNADLSPSEMDELIDAEDSENRSIFRYHPQPPDMQLALEALAEALRNFVYHRISDQRCIANGRAALEQADPFLKKETY